ncbi:neural/ectodermal development factor IMP-L2 isoform X2 [Scaptodrosophila lebanonensis]|nr:neural/ectodermal development factor IMP-L2 isoform X2 [Scaptodrosophila lebanonensis]
MNLNLCTIVLLLFGSLSCAHSRAIDVVDESNDVDNSIEAEEKPRSRPFESDWLKFTKTPPVKVLQTPGATIEIACEMMGSPLPTVQWVVGHMPLSEIESMESNVLSENAPSTIVRVRSVHVIDHMLSEPRTYTCVGRTGSKTVYASTVVYPSQSDIGDLGLVREKPYPGPQKPRIVYTEKTHLDLIGSNVLLPCKVHARPRAEITWLNNDGKVIDQSQRFKVLPTGDLFISELKWNDMGNYKCTARSSAGRDSAETFVYPVLKEED